MSDTISLDSPMPPAYIPRSMTPESFKAALDAKGIETQHEAAAVFGVEQSTVSRWMSGARPIPPIVAVALMGVAARRTVQAPLQRRSRRPRKTSNIKG